MNAIQRILSRPAVAITAFCLLAIACTSIVTKQDWDARHGPVVPHETFPADCRLCHVGNGWHEIRADFTFDHEAETGVPLEGAHADAACLRCHNDRGDVAQFAARGCAGCHVDVHRGQLGSTCQTCHDESTWRPSEQIARHNQTRMPLVGAHVAVACFRCHPGAQVGNFAGASPECITCHTDDLARAVSPNHAVNGWTDDCHRCHKPFAWQPAQFEHPGSFPLIGGHGGRLCSDCHAGEVFTGLSTDCSTCHIGEFQSTDDPDHVAAGFSLDCTQCHDVFAWEDADFVHPPAFSLTGAHVGRDCKACHKASVFGGLPSECVDCHVMDFQSATEPNHVAGGFSTACDQCHSTFDWRSATFEHIAAFPLSGGHFGLDCAQCHGGGVFQGLPSDCASCHLPDYQATTDPNHVTSAFPTDCTQCHTIAMWNGAEFEHPVTFPLTAAHAGIDCATCHVGDVYQGLPTNCSSCHLTDYQTTTNPPHAMQGIGTTCESCHSPTTWQNTTFVHTFPIQGGDHGGLACNDCHTTPAMPTAFSCTHCHEHRQSEMADEHDDVGGYVWSSPSCLACHPDGRDD